MTTLELYWGLGVSTLIALALGWYIKLVIEAEYMDALGFGAVMFVLGFLAGVKV